jgi:hypothetical protein
MAALSDYLEKLLLDWAMTGGAATRPTAWHLALYSAAPSDAGGGTELTGNGYAREAIAFAAATSGAGTTSNTAEITFEADGGAWSEVTHVGIFDASTSGNLLWHGSITAPRTLADGDKLVFAVGDVELTLA